MDPLPTPVTTLQLSADEAACVEACLARRRELLALAGTAPDGQILARCEEAAVELARATGLLIPACPAAMHGLRESH